MTTPILRGLAKAYSESLIDRKVYIRERRELIDNIVSGEAELVAYESPAPKRPPDEQRTFSDGEDTVEIPKFDTEPDAGQPPAPNSNKGRSLLIPFVLVALVCVAVAGGWWWNSSKQELASLETAPPPSDIPSTTSTPTETLLNNFLENNAWRDEDINAFMLAWAGEPAPDRAALSDSPLMRRAADSIAQKFLDENALMDLGDSIDPLATQRLLLDLARALAINSDRFKRQELEWHSRNEASLLAAATSEVNASAEPQATIMAPPASVESVTPTLAAIDAAQATPELTADEPPVRNEGKLSAQDESELAEAADEQVPSEALSAESSPAPSATPVTAPTQSAPKAVQEAPPRPTTGTDVASKNTGCRVALAKQRRPYCRDMLRNKIKAPLLAVLPAGQVEIGGRNSQEQPRHTVTLARPFAIGIFEVSAAEFRAYCEDTQQNCPSQPWNDLDFPVVNVSWAQANDYTKWLSSNSGATYRLPSEAEWEYAARGGTTSPYPFGDEVLPTHARFSFRNVQSQPLAANDKSINRNGFRLYHMIGNVREWVLDAWHDNYSGAPADGSARERAAGQGVARGGAYRDGADDIRSASRVGLPTNNTDAFTGFRVLREVQ